MGLREMELSRELLSEMKRDGIERGIDGIERRCLCQCGLVVGGPQHRNPCPIKAIPTPILAQ